MSTSTPKELKLPATGRLCGPSARPTPTSLSHPQLSPLAIVVAIIATVIALGAVENCIFRDRVWRGRNSVPNFGTPSALIVRQAKLPLLPLLTSSICSLREAVESAPPQGWKVVEGVRRARSSSIFALFADAVRWINLPVCNQFRSPISNQLHSP